MLHTEPSKWMKAEPAGLAVSFPGTAASPLHCTAHNSEEAVPTTRATTGLREARCQLPVLLQVLR